MAFAELEDFIDNQVKFYSSGMYVRLGFAVAVNVEPDVLLVDEVLAVGDANFQRKCLDHVKRFQREGRTIVVVSHGTDTIRQKWSGDGHEPWPGDHGRRAGRGDQGLHGRSPRGRHPSGVRIRGHRGERARHRDGAGGARRKRARTHMYPGESLTVTADVDSLAAVPNALATVAIYDDKNELIFASGSRRPGLRDGDPGGRRRRAASSSRRCRCWTARTRSAWVCAVPPKRPSSTSKDQVTQFEVANPGRATGRIRLPVDVSFRLRSTSPGTTGEVPAVSAAFTPAGRVGGVRLVTVGRIDQVIPALASRDAIGGHTMRLRDLLRSRGYRSDIYYGNASADRLGDGMPVNRLGDHSSNGRVLLYQLSIGSGVADVFRQRRERKFVNYHNITPADLVEAWIPDGGGGGPAGPGPAVRSGSGHRVRHRRLVLQRAGAAGGRLPVDHHRPAADRSREDSTAPLTGHWPPAWPTRRPSGGADLLFVGKVSPHKGQHDLVKALATYRQLYDPKGAPAGGRGRHQ